MDHLKEAMPDPCPECAIIPLAVRRSHPVGLLSGLQGLLLSSSVSAVDRNHKQTFQSRKKNKKTKSSYLEYKVDQLSSAVEMVLLLHAKDQPNLEVQEKAQI